jgi:hypothetical protein
MSFKCHCVHACNICGLGIKQYNRKVYTSLHVTALPAKVAKNVAGFFLMRILNMELNKNLLTVL